MIGQTDKKEVIYHNRKKGKYVIVVKDKEIGKFLYEVMKSLKSTTINTQNAIFKFTNYGVVRKNTVKWLDICAWASFRRNTIQIPSLSLEFKIYDLNAEKTRQNEGDRLVLTYFYSFQFVMKGFLQMHNILL